MSVVTRVTRNLALCGLLAGPVVIIAAIAEVQSPPDAKPTEKSKVVNPRSEAESPRLVEARTETKALPPQIHYHYHVHYQAPPELGYPNSVNQYVPWGPMTYYPWPYSFSPTQAHPYPPNNPIGPYAAFPFASGSPTVPQDKGVIEVFLPTAKADVFLNGQKTRTSGKTRRLLTPLLPRNQEYLYYVTATYAENGETVTKYRKVEVARGNIRWRTSRVNPWIIRSNFPPGRSIPTKSTRRRPSRRSAASAVAVLGSDRF